MKLRIFVQQDILELHLKKEIKQLVSKTVSSFFRIFALFTNGRRCNWMLFKQVKLLNARILKSVPHLNHC